MRPNPRRRPSAPTVPVPRPADRTAEGADRRGFIRHPATIPIHVTVPPDPTPAHLRLRDLGYGGLAFHSRRQLVPGVVISIHIHLAHAPVEIAAQVVWCSATGDGFDVGAQFLAGQDAFRVRMVEQICYIRAYRRQVLAEEGRRLTPREAALEWVTRHAASFPEACVSTH
ncbi:MAG: PilZ domain-containing protein [Deltaproteobacteria bacterium]|nr:PilZ domain-containing protein [Deltaproteobacteria bacterium]